MFLTMVVVIVINNQENASPALGVWDCIGLLLWITGFGIEVIADNQKTVFNSDLRIKRNGSIVDFGLTQGIQTT